MVGTLEVSQIGQADDVPIIEVRLVAVDAIGVRHGILFEYELPLNFAFHGELTNNFSAI